MAIACSLDEQLRGEELMETKGTTYREFKSHPGLAEIASCAWRVGSANGEHGPVGFSVPPDGTTNLVAIVVDRKEALFRIVGPSLNATSVMIQPNATIFGLRLRPHIAASTMSALPSVGSNEPRSMGDETMAIGRLWSWLAEFARDVRPPKDIAFDPCNLPEGDRTVSEIAKLIEAVGGRLRLSSLDSYFDLGSRQIRRRFRTATGLSMKQYAAVQQLRTALTIAITGHGAAATSEAAGYADQAHLARDTKARFGRSFGAVVSTIGSIEHAFAHGDDVRNIQDPIKTPK